MLTPEVTSFPPPVAETREEVNNPLSYPIENTRIPTITPLSYPIENTRVPTVTIIVPEVQATARLLVPANVRLGPGIAYSTISGGANSGIEVLLIGRNQEGNWLQVLLPDGREGWILGVMLVVSPGLDLTDLPVIQVPPTATTKPLN